MVKPLDPIKEERIIQAVFAITGRKGLAGIHITEISKEAGVGVGTLYTYFEGKEAIIQAAYFRVENQLSLKMYEQFDAGLPVRDSLKKLYINMLHYRLKHYDENVFLDQYEHSNYVQLNFDTQIDHFREQNKLFYSLLKRGQEEGAIVKLGHRVIICFLLGSVRELARCIFQKMLPLNKRAIEDNFNMAWKAISP